MSVAAKKRQKHASRKIAPAPKPEAANSNAPRTAPKRQGGIDWLVSKKRINRPQAAAGRRYGVDGRLSAVSGLYPVRSCLNDTPRGSGGSGLPIAIQEADAKAALAEAQVALSLHPGMMAALELVCIRDLTPWEALPGATQREVERMTTVLGLALDLLVNHYRLR